MIINIIRGDLNRGNISATKGLLVLAGNGAQPAVDTAGQSTGPQGVDSAHGASAEKSAQQGKEAQALAAIEAEKKAAMARREAAELAKSRHVQIGGRKATKKPSVSSAPSAANPSQPPALGKAVTTDGVFAGFS